MRDINLDFTMNPRSDYLSSLGNDLLYHGLVQMSDKCFISWFCVMYHGEGLMSIFMVKSLLMALVN